ncbi:MAG TPA: S1/P1 nuclease [Pyrinomonadaceae bacterium]|nr:S1/P1 nuclease [Pyrinomonadaceae bacterium]
MASKNSSPRRSWTSLCVLLSLLMMMPVQGFAWSRPGHNVVARIADKMLEENARQGVKNFLNLNADELWKISTWADDVRHVDFDENFQMKQFRPETSQWHFVDIPLFKFGTYDFESEYDEAKDCAPTRYGDCAIRAIVQFQDILRESAANPKANTNADLMAQLKTTKAGTREYFNALNQIEARLKGAEAIKFLVHFIGDLHQPLHTISNCYDAQCTRSDAGGNRVSVRLKWTGYAWDKNSTTPTDKMTNLHSTWDGDFVERDIQELIKNKKISPKDNSREAREEAYAEWLMKYIQTPAAEANLMDVVGWTRKTHQQAVQAYGPVVAKLKASKKYQLDDKEVIDLDDKYFDDNIENGVRRQLVLAGIRLAKVLNATLVKPQQKASQ